MAEIVGLCSTVGLYTFASSPSHPTHGTALPCKPRCSKLFHNVEIYRLQHTTWRLN